MSRYAGGGVKCLWWSHLLEDVWPRRAGVVSRLVARCVVVLRSFPRSGAGFVALVRIGLIVHG